MSSFIRTLDRLDAASRNGITVDFLMNLVDGFKSGGINIFQKGIPEKFQLDEESFAKATRLQNVFLAELHRGRASESFKDLWLSLDELSTQGQSKRPDNLGVKVDTSSNAHATGMPDDVLDVKAHLENLGLSIFNGTISQHSQLLDFLPPWERERAVRALEARHVSKVARAAHGLSVKGDGSQADKYIQRILLEFGKQVRIQRG